MTKVNAFVESDKCAIKLIDYSAKYYNVMEYLFGSCFPTYYRLWHNKDGNLKYFLINHTKHEVFRINRKETIFTEIEEAYKYFPKWLP